MNLPPPSDRPPVRFGSVGVKGESSKRRRRVVGFCRQPLFDPNKRQPNLIPSPPAARSTSASKTLRDRPRTPPPPTPPCGGLAWYLTARAPRSLYPAPPLPGVCPPPYPSLVSGCSLRAARHPLNPFVTTQGPNCLQVGLSPVQLILMFCFFLPKSSLPKSSSIHFRFFNHILAQSGFGLFCHFPEATQEINHPVLRGPNTERSL